MTATAANDSTLANRAFREVSDQLRLRGEASSCAIFEATRAALGLPEEDCAIEILDAICLAIRQGLVACNTFDPATGSIRIGHHTVLTPAFPMLQ